MVAGGYCDLCSWALAVFVWRLTLPDSLVNYLAWVVLSVLGARLFFNFNPLLKLDGYYMLSDLLEIPNLRRRAWQHVTSHLRWLLWGAPRPLAYPRSRFLLGFGVASWLFSLTFLVVMIVALGRFLDDRLGLVGLSGAFLLGWVSVRGLFHGLSGGEVRTMMLKRHKRKVVWLLILGAIAAALYFIEVEDRASGPFQVRPAIRAELRANVAGFLKSVHFEEGDRVSPGTLVALLEVPDLDSRLAQKRAELREAQAKLRLLEIGPRPEEVHEQRYRVERMKVWRDLAEKDLAHARQALKEELSRLDKQVAQCEAELTAARDAYERAARLRGRATVAEEQYQDTERRFHVAETQLGQAQAQKRHREALGTREAIAGLDAEAELARREKDLADAQAALNLLEAGSRPEEIEAERARLARLQEETRYLEKLQIKTSVTSPVPGVVSTPHLSDKIGQYLREGDLICQVEEPAVLEVEITISEQEAARVKPGQRVELKARALPFETFACSVCRVAPVAGRGDVQSTLTAYCSLEEVSAELLPGMTGYARVYSGKRPVGAFLLDRALRFLRTEFWW
jgi:multidrug efflux pump subunit AcrA (membrane-fusion protein)